MALPRYLSIAPSLFPRRALAAARFRGGGAEAALEARARAAAAEMSALLARDYALLPWRNASVSGAAVGFTREAEVSRAARALARRARACPARTRRHLVVWYHFVQANAWRTVFDDSMGTLESSALLRACGAELFFASPDAPSPDALKEGNASSGLRAGAPAAAYVAALNASGSFMAGRVRDAFERGVPRAESGELATLTRLQQHCRANPTAFALYLHDKGTRRPTGDAAGQLAAFLRQADWRRLQEYFLVEVFEDCVAALEAGHHTCGALLRRFPLLHYSGLFFWARCDYVAGLVDVESWRHKWEPHYWAELFIGGAVTWTERASVNEGPPCRTAAMGAHAPGARHLGQHCFEARMFNCYESRVNHYEHAWARAYYAGKRCKTHVNASYL
jgi:hypothetical protein